MIHLRLREFGTIAKCAWSMTRRGTQSNRDFLTDDRMGLGYGCNYNHG